MRRMFPAEDRASLGHHLFDETVTDARAHRSTAVFSNDFIEGLGANQVVHHRLARMTLQNSLGNNRGSGGTRNRFAKIIDEKHAIGVAVECKPDISTGFEHKPLQIAQVFQLNRVSRMIRERAVEFFEQHRQ